MIQNVHSASAGMAIKKLVFFAVTAAVVFSCTPKEPIVLRQVKDVVANASSEPTLKANAIFYNPNKIRMKLRKIRVDVFVNGKKTAEIDQELKTVIPAQSEFSVPLEVKLAMKELGLMDTIFGMLGGKKLEVRYEGSLRLTYHGLPIRVPINYKDEIRIKI